MMVHCPGCGTLYSIDDRKIPAQGGTLTCPECGKRWRAKAPLEVAARPETGPDSPPEAPAAQARKPARDSSGGFQNPVNCPKCGHLFIPYATAGLTPEPTDPARKQAPPRGRVLLVEDQKYFAELTREALEKDYETTVASNVAAARALIAAGGFDAVILDLSLEDGQDGTPVLQATKPRGIPVLIFTARDETELYSGIWEQLRGAGATDILIKGMHVGDELRMKVRSLLKGQRKQP